MGSIRKWVRINSYTEPRQCLRYHLYGSQSISIPHSLRLMRACVFLRSTRRRLACHTHGLASPQTPRAKSRVLTKSFHNQLLGDAMLALLQSSDCINAAFEQRDCLFRRCGGRCKFIEQQDEVSCCHQLRGHRGKADVRRLVMGVSDEGGSTTPIARQLGNQGGGLSGCYFASLSRTPA